MCDTCTEECMLACLILWAFTMHEKKAFEMSFLLAKNHIDECTGYETIESASFALSVSLVRM